MSRTKSWCFTLNNWTAEQQDHVISVFDREDVLYLTFGREVAPSTNTRHLQGFIQFSQRKRLTQCRQLFQAHWSAMRDTPETCKTYCQKDGDFEEFGELQSNPGGQPCQWQRLREFVDNHVGVPTRRELLLEFPNLMARYPQAVQDYMSAVLPPIRLTESTPRDGWQSTLAHRLESTPDARTVDFIVDPLGNNGKTWFCQYMVTAHPDKVQYLRIGKREDLCYAIDTEKSIFLFDIPRAQMEFLQYNVLEQIKDRMIFSSKYQSGLKLIRHAVHVVCFCNELPNMEKMSIDRFNIIELSNEVING